MWGSDTNTPREPEHAKAPGSAVTRGSMGTGGSGAGQRLRWVGRQRPALHADAAAHQRPPFHTGIQVQDPATGRWGQRDRGAGCGRRGALPA